MWEIKIEINLTDDEYAKEGKEIQIEIEEYIPEVSRTWTNASRMSAG